MLIASFGLLLALQSAPLPTPPLYAPVWAYGLTPEFVPGTSLPPAMVRPTAPVETWWWQFKRAETDSQDTLATRLRIDCDARTYQFLGHVTLKDGRVTESEPSNDPPVVAAVGTTIDGLVIHACDPDPDRPVRRYTNAFTARETMDDYFAGL